MGTHAIRLLVNGENYTVNVPARRLLSELLRDDLNLTGTKRGCETAICGACTVHVDGEPVKSCLMLATQANGRSVTTIEGLSGPGKQLHPVQHAFIEHGGVQCGYCTPGFIMTAVALLRQRPQPNPEEVRAALSGNLCRCTGYVGIVNAILAAAEKLAHTDTSKDVRGF